MPPPEVIPQIDAPRAIVDEFRVGFQVHAALAAVRQERIASASKQIESRLVDGIGQLAYQIDSDTYWLMQHKFGRGCWRDADFRRDCENKGMLTRVKGRADKTTLLMPGLRKAA